MGPHPTAQILSPPFYLPPPPPPRSHPLAVADSHPLLPRLLLSTRAQTHFHGRRLLLVPASQLRLLAPFTDFAGVRVLGWIVQSGGARLGLLVKGGARLWCGVQLAGGVLQEHDEANDQLDGGRAAVRAGGGVGGRGRGRAGQGGGAGRGRRWCRRGPRLVGCPRRRQRCPRDGLARGVPRARGAGAGGAPAELGRLLQGGDRRVPPPLRPLPPPPRPRPRHLHVQGRGGVLQPGVPAAAHNARGVEG